MSVSTFGGCPCLQEHPDHALPHAAEQIVRDGLRPRSHLIQPDPRSSLLSPEDDLVAQLGLVDARGVHHREVHGDPPDDRRPLSPDQDLPAIRERPGIPVPVSHRKHGDPGPARRLVGPTIADITTGRNISQLNNAGFEGHDPLDRDRPGHLGAGIKPVGEDARRAPCRGRNPGRSGSRRCWRRAGSGPRSSGDSARGGSPQSGGAAPRSRPCARCPRAESG